MKQRVGRAALFSRSDSGGDAWGYLTVRRAPALAGIDDALLWTTLRHDLPQRRRERRR